MTTRVPLLLALTLATAAGCASGGAGSTAARGPLPAGAQAVSLLGDTLRTLM
jgi:hypothetical protein